MGAAAMTHARPKKMPRCSGKNAAAARSLRKTVHFKLVGLPESVKERGTRRQRFCGQNCGPPLWGPDKRTCQSTEPASLEVLWLLPGVDSLRIRVADSISFPPQVVFPHGS